MEHAVENAKHAGHRGASAARAPAGPSGSGASLHPMLQLQQQAGNQAIQELLRSRLVQAKLAIRQPNDPEEHEADRVAHQIMRSRGGFPGSFPCACAEGGEMCEECQHTTGTVQRKPDASTTLTDDSPAQTSINAGRGACVVSENIPSSQSALVNRDGQIRQQFKVNIEWSNSPPAFRKEGASYCDCACGEYRQYIKGHLIVNGTPEKLKLWGGAFLEEDVYHEDSNMDGTARYGHRGEPQKMDETFSPDRANGCSYEGRDAPGVFFGSDIDLLYKFKGQAYDACNDTFGQIHEWEMRFKGKLNYGH